MKRTYLASLATFALIPVVVIAGGAVFSAIDPEIAAGHPDYARNYRLIDLLRHAVLWGGMAACAGLWLASCFLLLKAKRRSYAWLLLAAFGPLGFAVMAMLDDRAPEPSDVYRAFLGRLSPLLRGIYEVVVFVATLNLAFAAVTQWQEWSAMLEASRRALPLSQILQERDASGGMWAFSEGMEVMYLVVLLYLLWPPLGNMVGRLWRRR